MTNINAYLDNIIAELKNQINEFGNWFYNIHQYKCIEFAMRCSVFDPNECDYIKSANELVERNDIAEQILRKAKEHIKEFDEKKQEQRKLIEIQNGKYVELDLKHYDEITKFQRDTLTMKEVINILKLGGDSSHWLQSLKSLAREMQEELGNRISKEGQIEYQQSLDKSAHIYERAYHDELTRQTKIIYLDELTRKIKAVADVKTQAIVEDAIHLVKEKMVHTKPDDYDFKDHQCSEVKNDDHSDNQSLTATFPPLDNECDLDVSVGLCLEDTYIY